MFKKRATVSKPVFSRESMRLIDEQLAKLRTVSKNIDEVTQSLEDLGANEMLRSLTIQRILRTAGE